MRVAAIFGLGSSEKNLKPFREDMHAEWLVGLPASASQADAILIFGGDGTIHRHLAQLVKLQLPVLVVPCGSGNDFARALNLRSVKDSLAAWRKFCAGGLARSIDLGVITARTEPQGSKLQGNPFGIAEAAPFPESPPKSISGVLSPDETLATSIAADGAPAPHSAAPYDSAAYDSARYSVHGTRYYFCCVAGVGLDGDVARRANRLPRWLRGHGGYVVSLAPALLRFMVLPMRIFTRESSGNWSMRSARPTVLAAFANAPTFGGGMKIAPHAKLDDGLLDVCLVTDIDNFKLAFLFPTIYFGRHLGIPGVQYFRADALRVETDKILDVYADGEFVCQTPIEVGLECDALRVIVP